MEVDSDWGQERRDPKSSKNIKGVLEKQVKEVVRVEGKMCQ